MGFKQEFIDKVTQASNLVEIISQYTTLKPSGRGHMGRCPFPDHQEKTASFSVSEFKGVYHCFGCKKSGNVVSFLRDFNGMNFREAIEYLAERNGIVITDDCYENNRPDQPLENKDHKKTLLHANKIAAEFFRESLKRQATDSPVRQYVLKRKLNPETLEEFQIGYAPNEWEALAGQLNRSSIPHAVSEEAQLLKRRKEGTGYFDLFRDRLMFPIHSPTGEVLAFGGRIIEQGEPKYLNSPETPVFHKGSVLYGLAQTAKHVRSEDLVLVVEGYMDLVSLYQAGIKNVVATMGTALTPDHAKLIKRLTNNVVVLFDGDDAGKMAAERSLPILLSQGLFPRGITLTEAKDPDEFVIKFGLDALKKEIEKAPDLFKVILKSWMTEYRGEASDKVKLVDKIKPVFDVMADQRLKSLYADDLCQIMGVNKDWLRNSFQGNAAGRSQGFGSFANANTQRNFVTETPTPVLAAASEAAKADENAQIKISDASKVELMLLQNTLKSRANFALMSDLQEPLTFTQLLSQIKHLGVRQILENAEQVYRQDAEKFDRLVSQLIDKIDKPELLFQNSKLDIAQIGEFDEEKEKKLIVDLISRIQQEFIKDQAKRLALDLKSNTTDAEMLRQFSELQKSRLALKGESKK
ncbi:DNA primase [Pseudobdellovibrio sp. HCB154]|uniref:DNA primase n=1 Tax=Pseudobdellovibrio sp. HCB154 TaxID=3386277 RepID=UPI003916FF94